MRERLKFIYLAAMQGDRLKRLCLMTTHGEQLKFIAVMAALVAVVTFQTFFPLIKMRPLDENRAPVTFRSILDKIAHGNGRIASDINIWFDDHTGFRAVLTRLANQVDYSVFHYSKKVIIGKDGWQFDPEIFSAAIAYERNSNDLTIERDKLNAIAAFLNRRNIRLVVVSTPTKETMFSEYMPASTPHVLEGSAFQEFRQYLKAGDGRDWIYIDSQDILMQHKADRGQLYFHTDLHATTYGSLLVAEQVVNRLAAVETLKWRWIPEVEIIRSAQGNGSNERFLSILNDEVEYLPDSRGIYNPNGPPPGEVFEKSPTKPFEVIYHNKTDRPKFPQIVMFGSSFLDRYLIVGFYPFFKDIYRMRGVSDQIGEALATIPPGTGYFIYQFWEPHLSALKSAKIPAP